MPNAGRRCGLTSRWTGARHMADDVVAAGLDGILFPSQAHPGGTNLVIYRSSGRPSSQLRVYDPEGALR